MMRPNTLNRRSTMFSRIRSDSEVLDTSSLLTWSCSWRRCRTGCGKESQNTVFRCDGDRTAHTNIRNIYITSKMCRKAASLWRSSGAYFAGRKESDAPTFQRRTIAADGIYTKLDVRRALLEKLRRPCSFLNHGTDLHAIKSNSRDGDSVHFRSCVRGDRALRSNTRGIRTCSYTRGVSGGEGVTPTLSEKDNLSGPGVQASTSSVLSTHVGEDPEALVPLGRLCAEKNLCSRREAEYFAALGLVRVDGKLLIPPADSNTTKSCKLFNTHSHTVKPGDVSNKGKSGLMRKLPAFFVKRNADVQLMPRAQRVMANRITVLLHKPLHYLSCPAPEKTWGSHKGKPTCRELLTAERCWQPEINDGRSMCSSTGSCSTSCGKGNGIKSRMVDPGACSKMGCAGRLDSDSSGLVVFTQDGRIASLLVSAGASAVGKEYVVEVDLPITQAAADLLRSGTLTLDGRPLLPANIRLLPPSTPLVFDASTALSKSRFLHLRHSKIISDGFHPTVPEHSRSTGDVTPQSHDKEEAGCLKVERGGDMATLEDVDENARGTSSACQDAEESATRLQKHPGHAKDASSISCLLLGAATKACHPPPFNIHNHNASLIPLPNEGRQEPQGERESDALWAGKTTRMAIELFEGRHRQIRRMCELVGLGVLRLHRIRIGRVHLGPLPVGRWRYLLHHERFM